MIKKIVFVLVGLIVLFLASVFIFRYIDDRNEWKKTISKMDLSDHCLNNVYNSDYIGISIGCPDGLMAIEKFNGFQKTPKEGVNFVNKTKNMKNFNNIRNEYKFTAFSIGLKYEKFDPRNVNESVECGDKINELNPFNIVNKVEALCVSHRKINNTKDFYLGDNHYYSYAVEASENKRRDVLFLVRENEFIEFTFFNQNQDSIKNILSSVKTFEPVRE